MYTFNLFFNFLHIRLDYYVCIYLNMYLTHTHKETMHSTYPTFILDVVGMCTSHCQLFAIFYARLG